MGEKKELLCIVCPNGCRLSAELDGDELRVEGNGCPKGIEFARAELTNPVRSLTTTVRTVFPGVPALPVRTDGEIPKGKISEALAQLAGVCLDRRVGCGDTVLENLAGAGCRVIATSDILMEQKEG